jgi:hypothetical protein
MGFQSLPGRAFSQRFNALGIDLDMCRHISAPFISCVLRTGSCLAALHADFLEWITVMRSFQNLTTAQSSSLPETHTITKPMSFLAVDCVCLLPYRWDAVAPLEVDNRKLS